MKETIINKEVLDKYHLTNESYYDLQCRVIGQEIYIDCLESAIKKYKRIFKYIIILGSLLVLLTLL